MVSASFTFLKQLFDAGYIMGNNFIFIYIFELISRVAPLRFV